MSNDLVALLREAVSTIEDMRNEHKTHGHITDASAHWLIVVKPRIGAAITAAQQPKIPCPPYSAESVNAAHKAAQPEAEHVRVPVDEWALIAPDGRKWTGSSPLNVASKERNERLSAEDRLQNLMAASDSEHAAEVKRMVDRFLGWPLPKSVRPDDCVMDRDYPHRCGTNLLTATEATEMVEFMLTAAKESKE